MATAKYKVNCIQSQGKASNPIRQLFRCRNPRRGGAKRWTRIIRVVCHCVDPRQKMAHSKASSQRLLHLQSASRSALGLSKCLYVILVLYTTSIYTSTSVGTTHQRSFVCWTVLLMSNGMCPQCQMKTVEDEADSLQTCEQIEHVSMHILESTGMSCHKPSSDTSDSDDLNHAAKCALPTVP